jgi:hypothetical protein
MPPGSPASTMMTPAPQHARRTDDADAHHPDLRTVRHDSPGPQRTVDAEDEKAEATEHFGEVQLLETIALVGYYHAISFLCLGLKLPLESHAAHFPAHDQLAKPNVIILPHRHDNFTPPGFLAVVCR